MERKYVLLSVLMVILAFGLMMFPGNTGHKEADPKYLLASVAEKSRYLSVDQVTHRIIEKDPSLLLIDLRTPDQFRIFSLPGAINIQPDSLFTPDNLELFKQPGKDKILCANSDLIPEKAWLLCSRLMLNRVYIMKGGMNEWFNTIIKGTPVSGTPSSADLELISFRNAARQIFAGSGIEVKQDPAPAQKEKAAVIRKAPKASSGGGC